MNNIVKFTLFQVLNIEHVSETYHGHLSQNILKITILIAMHLNEKTIPGVYIHVLLRIILM